MQNDFQLTLPSGSKKVSNGEFFDCGNHKSLGLDFPVTLVAGRFSFE